MHLPPTLAVVVIRVRSRSGSNGPDVKYARWTGAVWELETVDSGTTGFGYEISLYGFDISFDLR